MVMTNEINVLLSLIFMSAVAFFPLAYLLVSISAMRRALFSTFLLKHVHALIRLGLPLHKGLEPCGRRAVWGSENDLQEVIKGLDSGELFGEALARVPLPRTSSATEFVRLAGWVQLRPVPRLVSAAEAEALRIGEQSGNLRSAIELVLRQRRQSQDIRSMLKNTFFYPIAMGLIAGAILYGFSVFIMPKIERMFAELDVALPALTRFVFSIPLAQISACIVLSTLLIVLFTRMLQRARPLSLRTDGSLVDLFQRVVFCLPLIRGATKRLFLTEFCKELAMLLRMGTPADHALAAIAGGTVHPVFRDKLNRAIGCIQQGERLPDALEKARFDARVVMAARMAESSSDLPAALLSLSEEFTARSLWATNLFVQLLPPILVLLLGLIIASIALSIFLPLICLMNKMG